MARANLLGTTLDTIILKGTRQPAYKILLFDRFRDSDTDIVLNRYKQNPIDITSHIKQVAITENHEMLSDSATLTIANDTYTDLHALFFNAWVKVYIGDLEIDENEYPIMFSGIIRGQPGKAYQRGGSNTVSVPAYSRACLYGNTNTVSEGKYEAPNTPTGDVNPHYTGAKPYNLGEIAVDILMDNEWGMGLDRAEVLFNTITSTDIAIQDEITKALQVVDENLITAINLILFPVGRLFGFNSEAKAVARDTSLTKPVTRVFKDNTLFQTIDIPQNTSNFANSVTIVGLDDTVSEVLYELQKLGAVQGTLGFFQSTFKELFTYSEDSSGTRFRCDFSTVSFRNWTGGQGAFFGASSGYSVMLQERDDYSCWVKITNDGTILAYLIVLAVVYLGLVLAAEGFGVFGFWSGGLSDTVAAALRIAAAIVLLMGLSMMQEIGNFSVDIWGKPYELVYKELEAEARLMEFTEQEKSEITLDNKIFSDITVMQARAKVELHKEVAKHATRSINMVDDLILECGDIIEDANGWRYYILSISRSYARGEASMMTVDCYRIL